RSARVDLGEDQRCRRPAEISTVTAEPFGSFVPARGLSARNVPRRRWLLRRRIFPALQWAASSFRSTRDSDVPAETRGTVHGGGGWTTENVAVAPASGTFAV